MSRSAAILIHKGQTALIERQRAGLTYYLFPGGTVEDGESLEAACVREIREELGLEIAVKSLLAEVVFDGNRQFYFICEIRGGVFGTGDGEEYSGTLPPEVGTYKPVWMDVDELLSKPVQPRCVCELIQGYRGEPADCRRFQDLGGGICVPLDEA